MIRLQGPGHAASLLTELNRCRQSRQYCDVVLQVGNRTFAAHRAVLACAGTYFRNLFARAPASPTAAFSLEFISPANFEKVLTFVYTGDILTDLIDVGVLYELAERLGVSELVRACHLKAEDMQSHIGYGQMAADQPLPGGPIDGVLPPGPVLQLKIEQGLEEEEAEGSREDRDTDGRVVSESTGSSLPQSIDAAPPDSCSFADSSAPLGDQACDLASSSEEPGGGLQVGSVEGGVVDVRRDGRLMFGEVEEGENEEEREALRRNGATEGEKTKLKLSRYLKSKTISSLISQYRYNMDIFPSPKSTQQKQCFSLLQVTGNMLSCKACAVPLPADSAAIRRHAETHLTELGHCRVCGASFPDRPAAVAHSLSHVGVQLFTCDMCHLQFCSQNKLLRHHRQTASTYTIPQVALTNSSQGLELQCAVCTKTLRSMHSVPSGATSNGSSGQDGGVGAAGIREKWYRCRYCGKRFAHSGEFTYHLRIHTGEKPYQCKVCQRFFRGRSTMICHLKTHAGALMYRCTVCGLFFSTLKLVSSHMELHKDHLPPDFNIEQTFMYNDHSKEPLPAVDT
uniref:Zinc finger and BTB domain containing 39 n=1 Tax=Sander lucioperca TaxID=283035 RepID=A0A8D0AN40_SANLU